MPLIAHGPVRSCRVSGEQKTKGAGRRRAPAALPGPASIKDETFAHLRLRAALLKPPPAALAMPASNRKAKRNG